VARSTLRSLFTYAARTLQLRHYFDAPGDTREQGSIAASAIVRALLAGRLLREPSHYAVERLVATCARRALGVTTSFGDDAINYLTERLDMAATRAALVRSVTRAKRLKAFDGTPFIGLAIDGTSAGRSTDRHCPLCRPQRDATGTVTCYTHHFAALSIVGTSITLPVDVEPYGPKDSEYAAGQRLLRRVIDAVGKRFAQYVVVDGGFATAPFLHVADEKGILVVARLKDNVPLLLRAAEQRFAHQNPTLVMVERGERIELWDAADFAPWEALHWPRVRVLRYRQWKTTGEVIDAYWLTNIPVAMAGSRALFRMAKSRWEIENQCFNDGKNRYGLEHICHHEANSIVINWLLTFLAMTIERLYRVRYLHRGNHPPLSANELCRRFWVSLIAGEGRHHRAASDTS
jgi:hypothetical protein